MIRVRDLKIAFEGKTVIDHVTLTIEEGELVVLLGKNGSGKSVLLKAMTGLIPGFEGDVEIMGKDPRDQSRAEGQGTPIGYVFQKGGLFDSLNVFDNTAFGLRRRGVDETEIDRVVRDSLNRVGLGGNEAKLPSELSGGMQKRVGLARVVCLKPSVILYDDPTAGLDPVLSDSIADLLLSIRREYRTTSLVATHDLKVAEKIADRILLLYQGKIVFDGPGGEFFHGFNAYASQFRSGDIEGPIDIF